MDYKRFTQQSGLKVLAMARLSQCEYSLMFYLLNCSVSNLDHVITTESELASLIGYEESTLREALENLAQRNLIRLHFGGGPANESLSLRVAMQFDVSRWKLDFGEDVTSHDAVVFPFRRRGEANLQLFEGEKKSGSSREKIQQKTWQRVFDAFVNSRSLDDSEITHTTESAKVLVETHPVDQVLLIIRHFDKRIPTLSLLASSWQHYQELFESETQKVDLLDARHKHRELDAQVRDKARELLDQLDAQNVSEEERVVLNVLIKHRHPRRQLFWAYQTRNRYPALQAFFDETSSLMLPVTSSGSVIKKPFTPE